MAINTYLSIITLNVIGLNAPKTQSGKLDKKEKNLQSAAYNKLTLEQRKHRLNEKGWEKIFHANGQDRKAGVAILISDKIDFKMKAHKERQRRTLFNG